MMRQIKLLLIIQLFLSCSETTTLESTKPQTPEDLIAHSDEFKRELITVTDGVHVAVGYALANSILIEGEKTNIIIDTTGSEETATEVKDMFDAINSNPVETIIYTHNHADHTYGATVFAEGSNPDIYAHSTTEIYLSRVIGILRPIISSRSNRMFGNALPKEQVENNGIGPFLEIGRDGRKPGLLYPTKTFTDQIEFEAAGHKVQLFHAPGETNDQLFVWLPEKKVLFPGDNFYKTFPNLYTIRGTPYRDLVGWVNSIDLMRYLEPEYLVPSHTRPIVGKENINTLLTTYRDAIQFVHDQTVRLMNLGLDPNEIAERLVLPKHLGDSPYLKEFYGTPEWSAKNVFSGYLGWFDGNPSSLKPLPLKVEAEKIIQLSGDWNSLFKVAEDAFLVNDFQWSLQLTDYLLRSRPDDQKTKLLRKSALEALGRKESNPNSRYYYLSSAAQLDENYQENDILLPSLEVIQKYPIESMMETLKVNVIPEKSLNKTIQLLFTFTDSPKSFSLFLRRGVLEVQPFMITGSSVQIKSSENDLKAILSGVKSLPISLVNGTLKVEGSRADLLSFFSSLRN
ncbi:MAG: alkyl sulfatase dimerization domain-containing protein [Pseudomonadota bacterium]|nr:alkyl sulfatase dimerization domain-containing protein [Pseudomonadota bacterium]